MAKKRKASGRNSGPSGPRELDPADARLGPITTYEDVANSEDEFFMERDRLMLDDEPGSKRRRQDDDMELSDEEILGYDDSEDDDERPAPSAKSKNQKKKQQDVSDDEGEEENEDDEDKGWWGSSKKEYYNADNIETEADALEEEAEAKRLQQKKLSKMADEDFMFDGDEWMATDDKEEAGDDVVTEVLKEVEITDDMTADERYRILKTRYPEFEHLVSELQEHQPLLEELREQAKSRPGKSLEAIKFWVLGCYVAALASYFAILTSPSRDAAKEQKALDPAELRDHDVMETLLTCREAWRNIQTLKSSDKAAAKTSDGLSVIAEDEDLAVMGDKQEKKKKSKAERIAERAAKKAAEEKLAQKLEMSKLGEDAVADLYDLPLNKASSKKQKKVYAVRDGSDSDFGEEDALDARTAADKAARKKSLKFYTSQIAQKANRRADAGRDAGGDMDIPHRERLRDRQQRLLAAAEKRGQKDSKLGAELGDDSDEDDTAAAAAMRNNEDEYYDMVANSSKGKKADKAARYAAYAAAAKGDRVVENETVDAEGKRRINYAIEKNKGLTPKRSKDVRNPRVKKKKQYEAKQKKLRSMKAVWRGGEPKGGYSGEKAGINAAVIKSVKL